MKHHTTRYGNPEELRHWVSYMGGLAPAARLLKRSPRSLADWLQYRRPVPWYAPEILRLRALEHADMIRAMFARSPVPRVGTVATPASTAANDARYTRIVQLPLPLLSGAF